MASGHVRWLALAQFDFEKGVYACAPYYRIFDETKRLAGPIAGTSWPEDKFPPELGGQPEWSKDNSKEIEKGWIKKGDTIEALAAAIGEDMDPALLKATVENYNRYCAQKKDPEFDRAPETLLPINKPPYYAINLWPGNCNTLGGPRRNEKAQVLDTDKKPIPRLYSAGELGSIFGGLYGAYGGNGSEMWSSAASPERMQPLRSHGHSTIK